MIENKIPKNIKTNCRSILSIFGCITQMIQIFCDKLLVRRSNGFSYFCHDCFNVCSGILIRPHSKLLLQLLY